MMILRAYIPCTPSPLTSFIRQPFQIVDIHAIDRLHATTIGKALPCICLLLLGLAAQLFDGLPGIMTHEFKGWKISQFATALALPHCRTTAEVIEVRPQHQNNAWRRACLKLRVFGVHHWVLVLIWATVVLVLLNPRDLSSLSGLGGEANP